MKNRLQAALTLGFLICFSSILSAAAPSVELLLSPSVPHGFAPSSKNNEPTQITLNIKNPSSGSLIKEALLDLSLSHLKNSLFLPTGFPHVEGKSQIILNGQELPQGSLKFIYMFPIRGIYELAVKVSPPLKTPAAFQPFETTFKINVKEQAFAVNNALILSSGLFILGLIAAFLLTRWNKETEL